MNFANRVVINTSTLVGAVLRPGSPPRQALLAAMCRATVCVSPATLAELERVLMRDKFDRYLDQASRREFVQHYRATKVLFPVSDRDEAAVSPSCRDPGDNEFLVLALHCSAQVLIASDEDLLVLNPWNGVTIQTPAQFLS